MVEPYGEPVWAASNRQEFWQALMIAHAQGFVTMDEALAAMSKADEDGDYGRHIVAAPKPIDVPHAPATNVRRRIAHRCCTAFSHAWESGTDNEGYEPLCSTAIGDDRAFVVVIGSGLPPINFCPWCGAAITDKESP